MAARALAPVILVAALACRPGDAPGDDTGSSTVAADDTGDGSCESLAEQGACEAAADRGCGWLTVLHVAREGDLCSLLDSQTGCFEVEFDASGCGQTPGCEPAEDPYVSLLQDGTALSTTACGGPRPVGWLDCTDGTPGSDVPLCTCACSLAT
ncbi:MAG: hypothetical protein IPH07_10325 [Deltaproteobacteria bacterium]|nr:hypothetical protein [Deltaproteobacteria bacterium]MBP7286542.1 hypothetical protein [Nannocystaceae bacterium]